MVWFLGGEAKIILFLIKHTFHFTIAFEHSTLDNGKDWGG